MTVRPLSWTCYPLTRRPPEAVEATLQAFVEAAGRISSTSSHAAKLKSSQVLAEVRGGLEAAGFEVERPGSPVTLPVLFGDVGKPRRQFRADAWNPKTGVVVEVEAGGARQNNRALLDIIKGIVWADCRHLVIAVKHSYGQAEQDDFLWLRDWIELLYASDRVELPFESLTVVGY